MAKSAKPTQNLVPTSGDILNRAADTALQIALDGGWGATTLRDVAMAAGTPFLALYREAASRSALVDFISERFDQKALGAAEDTSFEISDRLFEAVMARLEAMEPHRIAISAMLRDEGPLPAQMGRRMVKTSRALLEAAGIDAGGRRGAVRIAAMTLVWSRVLQVWRDDEGALNRTMAEIDKRLKQMRRRLGQVGAGY